MKISANGNIPAWSGFDFLSKKIQLRFLRVIQETYHCSNHNVLHELSLVIIVSDSPTPIVSSKILRKIVSEPQNIIIRPAFKTMQHI